MLVTFFVEKYEPAIVKVESYDRLTVGFDSFPECFCALVAMDFLEDKQRPVMGFIKQREALNCVSISQLYAHEVDVFGLS